MESSYMMPIYGYNQGMSNIDPQPVCMEIPPAFDEQETRLIVWLEKIAAKDENALAAFYDATVNRVYGLALRITRASPVAEEVTSDVYWQVWQQADRYDATRGKVLTWLLTLCRSRALDTLRRRDSAESCAEPELLITGAHSSDDDPLGLLLMVERDNTLHAALKTLDSTPRQLLALAFFKGLSHQEIADYTGMPLGSVKSVLRNAMGTLKPLLHHSVLPFRGELS
jgi:RNA polymerase sigma-70 factor (ECF subfamily)